jgi:transcriptional regulator with XRE-family HTH domain
MEGMITPHQCRAARAMVQWTQDELAEKANIGVVSVRRFEQGKAEPYQGTQRLLRQELEKAGVRFLGDYGVEFRPAELRLSN